MFLRYLCRSHFGYQFLIFEITYPEKFSNKSQILNQQKRKEKEELCFGPSWTQKLREGPYN